MPRPLRIAQVSPYGLARFGGVRSHIRGLGEALLARGHAVTVIAPGDRSADEGADTGPTLGSLPVIRCGTVHPMDFSGTRIDLAWASRAERRHALAAGFDVLHLHTPWNPAIPLQLAMAYRGVRVATFHDVPGDATPWWARSLMPVGAALLRRLVLRATIGVSPAVSAYLGEGTHVVIPNGVSGPPMDTMPGASGEAVDRAARGDDATDQPIVYLGRLEPRKDVETLLNAMARVRDTLGDASPPLVIAGDGPLRASLEDRAHHLALPRVTFCGPVTESEKWALLARARCVVAPSRAGESFGIILLEAMRAGSVPIAAANPGYRHVLDGHGAALCFPPGSSEGLADRLLRMIRDAAWRTAMRQWCEGRWPRFTWTDVAVAVEQVYHRAMDAS